MPTPGFDFRLRACSAVVHRTPITRPVRTAFGTMHDRPAVFLRVTDEDGRHGYGEVWCNFPTVAAEHRARLATELVGPTLMAMLPHAGTALFEALMQRLHLLALQSGEWGPLRQVCAGFDAAMHDLAARRAGLPLYRYLGGPAARRRIGAYASGIGPEAPASVARAAAAAGHVAFKVKVGFGRDTDLASLDALRAAIGPGARLMADANQGWTLDEALALGRDCAGFGLHWLEEPLPADRPLAEWQRLAEAVGCPLAAGENVNAADDFAALIPAGILGYLQPDLAKWGGISGCLAVARQAPAQGVVYCPHFLGSGVGLMASAHVLAAQGGDGLLEMDVNPNPLRDALLAGALAVTEGTVTLPDGPGLGFAPDALFS